MRSWIWGGLLAILSARGVYFVFTTNSAPSDSGPCIQCLPAAEALVEPVTICGSDTGCAMPPVTDVFDVTKALEQPAPPKALPFISFDEPPFAKPVNSGIVQASFGEPVTNEIAPFPRERDDTTPGIERLPAPRLYQSF